MKTIEDKLHIAHELGRIAGASECIEDEGTRDTIYGAAESLFDGLLTEAGEESHLRDTVKGSLWNIWKGTNFARITKSPEVLARDLAENVYECPRGECPYDDRHGPSTEDCVRCLADWLNEEVEEE